MGCYNCSTGRTSLIANLGDFIPSFLIGYNSGQIVIIGAFKVLLVGYEQL